MKRSHTRMRFFVLIAVLAAALMAACGPSPPTPEAEPAESVADPADDESYTVRGLVMKVPESDDGTGALSIQHEAIPDFKGIDGEVWGMDSMTMNFGVSEGVSIDEISAGDKIEFVLVVNWESEPTQAIIQIVKLPPETELDLAESGAP